MLKGNKKCRCFHFRSLGEGNIPAASSSFAGVMVVMDESGRLPLSNSCQKAGVCNGRTMFEPLQQHGGSSGQWAGSSWQPPGGSVGASGGEAAASQLHPCPGPLPQFSSVHTHNKAGIL